MYLLIPDRKPAALPTIFKESTTSHVNSHTWQKAVYLGIRKKSHDGGRDFQEGEKAKVEEAVPRQLSWAQHHSVVVKIIG